MAEVVKTNWKFAFLYSEIFITVRIELNKKKNVYMKILHYDYLLTSVIKYLEYCVQCFILCTKECQNVNRIIKLRKKNCVSFTYFFHQTFDISKRVLLIKTKLWGKIQCGSVNTLPYVTVVILYIRKDVYIHLYDISYLFASFTFLRSKLTCNT